MLVPVISSAEFETLDNLAIVRHQHQNEDTVKAVITYLVDEFRDRVKVYQQVLKRPLPDPVLEVLVCKGVRKLKLEIQDLERLRSDLSPQIARFLEPLCQTIVSEESISLNRDTVVARAQYHLNSFFFVTLSQGNCDLCSDIRPFLLTLAKLLNLRQTGSLYFFSISSNDFPDDGSVVPIIRTTPALLCSPPRCLKAEALPGFTPTEWLQSPQIHAVLPESDIGSLGVEWNRLELARQEYLTRRVSFHACITKTLINPGDVEDRIRFEEAIHKNETMAQCLARLMAVTEDITRDTKWLIEWNAQQC
eukprot:Protomagalhaensia_wolfi_Nauph_80__5410@NODE_58_length_4115_cov_351_920020_g48_i0_p3_GENE_NODE_58_length_4115_cov_351_920020_g48_i0NODE_58_length_4115_cov_351_920020_g48_i0_p3_ORF_typecomplete_len306_score47_66_NODE_58_length_4115_cov_351_920020_g48_i049966